MKAMELRFDKQAPANLKKLQEWFASILVRPVDQDSRMNPISPSQESMEEEAFEYIVPSPTLRPAQRIELYNQQYWWRLLSILHDATPLVVRLFGHHDFNEKIGKPYLTHYPPDTWSLNFLSDRLPQWIDESYQENDKQLVLDAARVDAALNYSFFAAHYSPVNAHTIAAGMDKTLKRRMSLQPHVFLFNLRYDMFAFRQEMIKQEAEYWENHDFPNLAQDRPHYFVVYRNSENNLQWDEIDFSAFRFLNLFLTGTSLEEACEWLEQQDEQLYAEAASKLHLWLQEWVFRQWLYFDDKQS
ncbi:putative DNA-binding domain-containing protein [Neochlamydia sp. AcF84]|uniref:HvfC/BufC family peptide modification chaperone n=1 Tax=Neochlamydia sp. AcF84 TaxID=2315858 RepID=UPI00140AB4F0|nr:putative DNA-binding domain-containing protein [Neochlamydia sp. AcF84]